MRLRTPAKAGLLLALCGAAGLFAYALAGSSGPARAACADPVGYAGDQIYNSAHKVMQYCNAANKWIPMWGNSTGGGSGSSVSECEENGGAVVGGACWFFGATDESCDTVCLARNGYNIATRDFAGSGGSDANCLAVLDALNVGTPGDPVGTNAFAMGCMTSNSLVRYRGTTATTSNSNGAAYRRACACNYSVNSAASCSMSVADSDTSAVYLEELIDMTTDESGDYLYALGKTSHSIVGYAIADPANIAKVDDHIDATNLYRAGAIAVKGGYAYVALTDSASLSVYAVNNGTIGALADTLSLPNQYGIFDLEIVGTTLFATSVNNDSIAAVNIATPSNISLTGTLVNAAHMDGAAGFEIVGNYAYIANSISNKLTVVNISNPASMSVVSNVTGAAMTLPYDVAIKGNYAYVTGGSSNSVTAFNISNPAAPVEVGNVVDAAALNYAARILIDGNTAYVTSANSDNVVAIDITGAATMAVKGSLTAPGMDYMRGIALSNSHVFAGSFGGDTLFSLTGCEAGGGGGGGGPTCAGAGGVQTGGACWFLGTPGANCTTTCSAKGMIDDTATLTYAGTHGSNANCAGVLTALSVTAGSTTTTGGAYVGCGVADNGATRRWYQNGILQGSDYSSTLAGFQRACACHFAPDPVYTCTVSAGSASSDTCSGTTVASGSMGDADTAVYAKSFCQDAIHDLSSPTGSYCCTHNTSSSGTWTVTNGTPNGPNGTGMCTGAAGGGEKVFSTTLYSGNGSNRTLTTNVNTSTGGLVVIKARTGTSDFSAFDTVRGALQRFNMTGSDIDDDEPGSVTSFGAVNIGLGTSNTVNQNGTTYVAWTFKEKPGFLDVVQYTGNGAASQTIAHNLGVAPGLIIIKEKDEDSDFIAWHRSNPTSFYNFNDNSAVLNSPASTIVPVSTTGFTVSNGNVGSGDTLNENSHPYIAYVFAHDPGGVMQCGTYTGNGVAIGPTVALGWEPEFLMINDVVYAGNAHEWTFIDSQRTRGMKLTTGSETAGPAITWSNWAQSTGFQVATSDVSLNGNGSTFVYCAIKKDAMSGGGPTTSECEDDGGEVVGGACWFLGAMNASCTTTCGAHGGYNAATLSYAGSGGSNANCGAVLDAVGGGGAGASTDVFSNAAGCYTTMLGARSRGTVATTEAATISGLRACACNRDVTPVSGGGGGGGGPSSGNNPETRCAAADGEFVGDACWFLGAANENCADACDNVFGLYDSATLSVAGSGAPDNTACTSVLTALGAPGSGSATTVASAAGCHVNGATRRRGTTATTDVAAGAGIVRACACKVGGDDLGNHTAAQDINMNNNRIVSLGAPTASTDIATKGYVDSKTGATETDPQVGALTADKWCYVTGGVLVCDQNQPGGGGMQEPNSVIAVYQKVKGADGGTPGATAAWNAYPLNMFKRNNLNAFLVNNGVQLAAGTYYIDATLSFVRTGALTTRLMSSLSGTPLIEGMSVLGATAGAEGTRAYLRGLFTLNAQGIVTVQYNLGTAEPGIGLGQALDQGPEIYGTVYIEKVD